MADSTYTKFSWPLLAFLIVCLGAIAATTVFTAWTASRMIGCHAELTAAAKDVRLEGLTARLWFEEIVHGEYQPDMNQVWEHFREADRDAELVLVGANASQLTYMPVETPEIRQQVVAVRRKLRAVSELTQQRWAGRDVPPDGQTIGANYDTVFTDFSNSANDLEENVALLITQKAGFFRSIAVFSTAVTILLAGLAVFVIVIYMMRHAAFASEQQDSIKASTEKSDELDGLIYEGSQDIRGAMVNLHGFSSELAGSCGQVTGALSDASAPAELRQRISPVVTHDIPDAVNRIRTSVNHISTITNGLLRVLYLGRISPHVQSVDMDSVVGQVVTDVCVEADRREAVISVESLPRCKGDPEKLRDIFTGLIDNALKYLSPDRPGRIRVFGRTERNRAIYAVEDNGIGIEQESQAKVFQAFKRAAPSDYPAGEGLGLTVVKSLVSQQNGMIWLESQPGKGSTFYVSLPTV
jgi:signal transduction histidine kinase